MSSEGEAMGAAVFAVIEYEKGGSYWAFGELDLLRDNRFLSAIAWGDGGVTDEMPHPPRGIPSDCSSRVRNGFYVGPEEVREYLEIAGPDGKDVETSLKEYVAAHGEWALQEYSESGLLPQPELTGYGWLNLTELRENLAHADVANQELTPPYLAVIAAMESLAAWVGAEKVRLVFWLGM
jgi:hypothetical protein